VRLLKALGLWADLAETTQPILKIKVADGSPSTGPSPLFMQFDHAEIEEGPMGHMVEDRFLRPLLQKTMARYKTIDYIAGTALIEQSISGSEMQLTLSDGCQISTSLLIGADGRKSPSAGRAGIKRIGWDYGQTALVCAIEHEIPHHGVACQYFLPAGPLAILPLTENRASIVWSETAQNAKQIMALNEADYLSILQPRIGDYLGKISMVGKRYSYPLDLTLAQSFIAPRLALIGDAAHGVHPIAGQGLNAGLRDIAALVQVLKEAKSRGEDIGASATLIRYQEWRRFDATSLALATDTFNRLFSNDNSLLRLGRDIGMAMINAVPKARRSFIREAAGLTGTLPDLMR
jgi:2-octaprenyl-6-methoxyphenol hydroxylase